MIPDWAAVPVVDVPLARFVIPLHDIQPDLLWLRCETTPVHAFSRWPEHGDVWVSDGRHRVLRALLRGETTVPTRLLVID